MTGSIAPQRICRRHADLALPSGIRQYQIIRTENGLMPNSLLVSENMDARQASSAEPQDSKQKFLAWLDETSTRALISEDRGRFYAHCIEFGVAGSGATKEEAIEDATALLVRYLVVSYSEGRSYRETKKSPPVGIRLRSLYLVARTKLLHGIRPSLSRLDWLISVPTTNLDSQRLAH